MGCCNTGFDLPKNPKESVPIPENYIRRIESRLFKRLKSVFHGVLDQGKVDFEILNENLEESGLELLLKRFRSEKEIDYRSLVSVYLLISNMPTVQKCLVFSSFTHTIDKPFVVGFVSTVVELSCSVIPFLSYYESQLNSYPIEHYLTGIRTSKGKFEDKMVNQILRNASDIPVEDFVTNVSPVLLESKKIRAMLNEEYRNLLLRVNYGSKLIQKASN